MELDPHTTAQLLAIGFICTGVAILALCVAVWDVINQPRGKWRK